MLKLCLEFIHNKGSQGFTKSEFSESCGHLKKLYDLIDEQVIFRTREKRGNQIVFIGGDFLSAETKVDLTELLRREKIILARTKTVKKTYVKKSKTCGEVLIFDGNVVTPTLMTPVDEKKTVRRVKAKIGKSPKIKWTAETIQKWLADENYEYLGPEVFITVRKSSITVKCEKGHVFTSLLMDLVRKRPFARCKYCKGYPGEILPFAEARSYIHSLNLTDDPQWENVWLARSSGNEGRDLWTIWQKYCQSGKKPINIPYSITRSYKEEFNGIRDWLGVVEWANKKTIVSDQTRKKYKEIIQSLSEILSFLPQKAFWHILDASGLNATVDSLKLLNNYQRGKLQLNDLVEELLNNSPAKDEELLNNTPAKEYDGLWQKGLINPIDKAYNTMTHPLVATLDEEVISAIIAELQDEIWAEIFKASMEGPGRESKQIDKIKHILAQNLPSTSG